MFCIFLPFAVQGVSSIDINTAPLEELEEIIGIGPVLAQRIIEARPFDSLDDLIKVKGIGETTLQKIKDQGLAWVTSQAHPAEAGQELKEENYEDDESVVDDSHQQAQQTYPTGIIFNEILPSPEGADAEEEWIEIFNQNDFDVDLSGWTIKDTTGSAKTYTLNAKIPANGYLVLSRPQTNITLNNSGDGLNLINPNKEIIDSIDFGKAFLNQSYNRVESDWTWSTTLTPGAKNVIPQPSQSTPAKSSTEEIKKPENESREVSNVADVNLSNQKSKPPIWLIALIVAISSGIAILIVKNSLF